MSHNVSVLPLNSGRLQPVKGKSADIKAYEIVQPFDYIEFARRSANPGAVAGNTLYQDDGTNYDDGTLVWDNYLNLKGATRDNLMYSDHANDGVVFGGTVSTFSRNGTTIKAAALAIKPDLADWNAAGYGMYSTESLRTTDFSMFKFGGTVATPAALTTSDWISNMRFEGADSDATLQVAAGLRVTVYDTVASGVVSGETNMLVADNLGNLKSMQTWNYEQIDFLPLADIRIATGGATTFNRNSNDQLTVFQGATDNRLLSVRASSSSGDQVGIGVGLPKSKLGVAGSFATKVLTVSSASATLGFDDQLVNVTYTTTGAVTITLPSATSAWNGDESVGRTYTIKDGGCNASANNITISAGGSDTIVTDTTGNASVAINENGAVYTLQVVDSTTWALI